MSEIRKRASLVGNCGAEVWVFGERNYQPMLNCLGSDETGRLRRNVLQLGRHPSLIILLAAAAGRSAFLVVHRILCDQMVLYR